MAYPCAVKALVIAPAWVGDMVMANTLMQCLAAQSDDVQIHVVAPPASAALATRMMEVEQVHQLNVAHGELGWSKRREMGRQLRREQFAIAYVLPNSWKSALVPVFARIPRRVGWQGEIRFGLLNDLRALDRSRYSLMIERFMALADENGQLPNRPYALPVLQPDAQNVERLLAELGLSPDRVAILCPGAEFGEAKKWPAAQYAEVARALLQSGRQVWLLGSPNDVKDCAAIEQLAPGVNNLAGRTSLLDAVDLLSLAQQAVCNDSGLMHAACAVGVPTIGIFGSTSPEFTPPLGANAVVVERELDCRPCFQRTCPLGHLNCLRKLPADQVIDQLNL